jgi:hypothetical protein
MPGNRDLRSCMGWGNQCNGATHASIQKLVNKSQICRWTLASRYAPGQGHATAGGDVPDCGSPLRISSVTGESTVVAAPAAGVLA